eukprot:s557_g22.t1
MPDWQFHAGANVFQCTAAISGSGDWRGALQILQAMPHHVVRPTVVSYNASLNLHPQSAWQRATQLAAGAAETHQLDAIRNMAQCSLGHGNPQVKSVEADDYTYNSAMNSLSATGEWERSQQLVELCLQTGRPDHVTFNTLLTSCSRGRCWHVALHTLTVSEQIHGDMSGDLHLELSSVSLGALLSAVKGSESTGAWRRACWMAQCHTGQTSNVILHNSAMACSPWTASWTLLERLAAPNVISFSTAMRAGGPWPLALNILEQMLVRRFVPNRICCNGAIDACRQHGQWQHACLLTCGEDSEDSSLIFTADSCIAAGQWLQARGLLKAMWDRGSQVSQVAMTISSASQCQLSLVFIIHVDQSSVLRHLRADLVSYNSLLQPAEWCQQLQLMGGMCSLLLTPDATSRSSTMLGCEKASAWRHAICLADVEYELVTQNAAMAASARACDWRLQLDGLKQMPRRRLQGDVLSCNVAIDACQKSSRWAETLQLLAGNFLVDELSFKVAMAACEKMARWQQLLVLLTAMRSNRMVANASSPTDCRAGGVCPFKRPCMIWFLIRRRMAKLKKKVLLIQKVYRKWLSLPKMRRLIHLRTAVIRKQQAKLIQNYWRQHAEKNLVKKIQQGERPKTTT